VGARERVLARGFAVAVGLGYAWAAAVTVERAFVGLDFLRSFRWPLYSAEAAILALIALITIAGATLHVAGLAAASVTILAFMLAKYDSESALAPLVGVSTALLLVVYVRAGLGSIRMLPRARLALLMASVFLAVIAILRMEDPAISLDWQRVRTPAGGIEIRQFPDTGNCRPGPPGAKDVDEIDSGCSESIPAERAGWVIGFTASSAALAIAALARAPRIRRLSDATPVPIWM
jgi:hypothetical protein